MVFVVKQGDCFLSKIKLKGNMIRRINVHFYNKMTNEYLIYSRILKYLCNSFVEKQKKIICERKNGVAIKSSSYLMSTCQSYE